MGIKLLKHHTVYTIKTHYVPPSLFIPRIGLDWNAVLDGQAQSPERNQLICDLIEKGKHRHWLVLVKRIKQAELIRDRLSEKQIECELLVGNKHAYNRKATVIIGTVSKVGVGFDNINIDSLLIAADIKAYFIQSLGRCMRNPSVNPIVVDLIDHFNPLVSNFKEREKVYRDHGGTIKETTVEKFLSDFNKT